MQFTFSELWASMGVGARAVVFVLAIMSVYVVGITIERYIHFSRARRASSRFMEQLRQAVRDRASLGAATGIANEHPKAPLAHVVQAAAVVVSKGANRDSMELVLGMNRAIERVTARETSYLKRGLGGLATIASTAPFVGLFGTVLGIINAFQLMAASGSGGLATVSAGISEALITTAFGLLVAIPAVGLFNLFNGSVEHFTVDMEEVGSELVETVVVGGSNARAA